jgi:hypothetical protein
VSRPNEILIAVGIVVVGALAFVGVALVRGPDTLKLPVGVAIIALAVAVGVFARLRFARIVALVVVFAVAVVHLLIALADQPGWVRLVSGILAAAHVYVAVLLNTLPARQYLEPK